MGSLTVQTNILAQDARRNAKIVGTGAARVSQRLASGHKINTASDDAAGLAISEKMRAQIRGLNQAEFNIQDGANLLITADGALQEAQNIVHRIRELAVQSCNDTNEPSDREKLNEEYEQLLTELEKIAINTEFNKKKLFTGEWAAVVFKGLKVTWGDVKETDPLNNSITPKPTMTKLPTTVADPNVNTPTISGSVLSIPPLLDTSNNTSYPNALNDYTGRPARDLSAIMTSTTFSPLPYQYSWSATANDLTGDQTFTAGSVTPINSGDGSNGLADGRNVGGKIIAQAGTDTLTVTDNTSYKNNIDGSWNLWQGQRSTWISAQYVSGVLVPGTNVWSAWSDDETRKVDRIEDHSIVSTGTSTDGGIAGAPPERNDTTTVKYRWDRIIDASIPTNKFATGDTAYDREHDEWEMAEIYSAAKTTIVGTNSGGTVFVRNTAAGAETNITNNSASSNYYLGGSNSNALVDTDTEKVTVSSNTGEVVSRNNSAASTYQTASNSGRIYAEAKSVVVTTNNRDVVSRNQSSGSTYKSNTSSGTIYAGAEDVEVTTTNSGWLNVDSSGTSATKTTVGANTGPSADIRTDSFTTTVASNYQGAIADTNSDAGTTFTLTGINSGTRPLGNLLNGYDYSGRITTAAQTVAIGDNGQYGYLVTTNSGAGTSLTISGANAYNGTIATKAETVTIVGAQNGNLLLDTGVVTATVASTGANSVTDVEDGKLTITGNAAGQIHVGNGAEVIIRGTTTARMTIDNGGTVTLEQGAGGVPIVVETGATLNIIGDITGTIYVQAGANLSFTGEMKGTIVFTGDPASFSHPTTIPLKVAAGGTVEMQNTTSVHIGENNGTVRLFNSTANIANNTSTGTLRIDGSPMSTATVTTNSGYIYNLGTLVPNGVANAGKIDNYENITGTFPNGTGTIDHYTRYATDADTYDASGVNFPTVVNGELEPAVQTSVVRLTMNGQVYTMTADWKPTAARTDSAATGLCDCTVGLHNRNECTNLDLGLVADAFELRFNLDRIAPPLQTGEKFIALQHPSLNGPGLRYDIVGRDIVYNVDQDASIRESWERGKALYLQTGANSAQGYNVHLPKLLEGMNAATAGCVFCDCGSLRSANLLTRKSSTGALDVCDLANDNISEVRGYIGAQINRLMYAGNSVAVSSENLSAAESRIRDADMAKETMNLAKSKTLEQSSFSMLAQANQTPQTVLRLLQ